MKLTFAIITAIGMAAIGALTLSAQATTTAQTASTTTAAQSQWDGVYTAEQAERGEKIYYETKKCVLCHNKDLWGFSEDMKLGPALRDVDFAFNWDGATLGELFEKIHTTMPANYPGTLTEQEAVDAMSFILKTNGAPAGTMELPPNAEKLKDIKYLSKKPAAGN